MYVQYNANPDNNFSAIDCTVRAISAFLDLSWDETYIALAVEGFEKKDMPNANSVWGSFLDRIGCHRTAIPNTCPNCYTIRDFCKSHSKGKYLLATGRHVVPVIDGKYFDTWDSGDEVPIYCWTKGEN